MWYGDYINRARKEVAFKMKGHQKSYVPTCSNQTTKMVFYTDKECKIKEPHQPAEDVAMKYFDCMSLKDKVFLLTCTNNTVSQNIFTTMD